MDEDLPSEFDLIVIGTGLIESIIAAASSRVGKTVLHVDSNEYYGDIWASFNLDNLQQFINRSKTYESEVLDLSKINLAPGERLVNINNKPVVSNIEENWFIPKEKINVDQLKSETNEENKSDTTIESKTDLDKNDDWSQDKLFEKFKEFNIDLAPKILYSRGEMVELLISSNAARYLEFRNLTRILTLINNELKDVPCSRADVFASKSVTMLEKRMLMKLLTDVLNQDSSELNEDDSGATTFYKFLKNQKLNETILHYVLYSMAASDKSTSFKNGLNNLKKFLVSLGRYGNSPFLWTVYGTGEFPQCFCRLSAVFGGVYCLNRQIKSLIINDNDECVGIVIGNQKIYSKHIVINFTKAPLKYLPDLNECDRISRGIYLIDKSIKSSDKENITYLRCPSDDNNSFCEIIEVGSGGYVCPKNLYILYMFRKFEKSTKEDLEPFVKILLNPPGIQNDKHEGKPNVLWSLNFNIPDLTKNQDFHCKCPKKLFITNGPDMEIDFTSAVQQANTIFGKLYENEEFLPRCPDPDEIVFDDDYEKKNDDNEKNDIDKETKDEQNLE